VQFLGKNPEELERIARLSPFTAAKEIARIEDKIGKKKVKAQSSAPEPITPVGGGGTLPSTDLATMNTTDFMKTRNESTMKNLKK